VLGIEWFILKIGPVLSRNVKSSAIPDSMKMSVLDSLLSCFPSWSADHLDLGDYTLSLFNLASIFVLEDAKSNLPQQSFIFEVPLVVSDRFFECSLIHDSLAGLKDTDQR